jgi:hypothetical protein
MQPPPPPPLEIAPIGGGGCDREHFNFENCEKAMERSTIKDNQRKTMRLKPLSTPEGFRVWKNDTETVVQRGSMQVVESGLRLKTGGLNE